MPELWNECNRRVDASDPNAAYAFLIANVEGIRTIDACSASAYCDVCFRSAFRRARVLVGGLREENIYLCRDHCFRIFKELEYDPDDFALAVELAARR